MNSKMKINTQLAIVRSENMLVMLSHSLDTSGNKAINKEISENPYIITE